MDEWGCVWTAAEDGVVGEVKTAQLEDWSALDSFQPPWEVLERATPDNINRTQETNLKSDNPKFLNAGSTVRPFERLQFLRGSENLYMDLAYDSAELRRLMDMVHEFYVKEIQGLARTAGDIIGFGDDWGSQKTLLISPDMWRHYFKPLYKQYCDIIRGAGKKVFFHSDGNITSIYEDLIEIGINAVNSQLFCMDIEELGRRFKGRITFWGEIDRQHVLPFGTVDDVYRAVGRVRAPWTTGAVGSSPIASGARTIPPPTSAPCTRPGAGRSRNCHSTTAQLRSMAILAMSPTGVSPVDFAEF